MPVIAECFDCGRQYRLADDKAGRKIRCKQCGSVVDVPKPTARPARKRRQAASRPAPPARRRAPQRSSKNDKALLYGGIAAGAVVCLGLGVFFGAKMMSGGSSSNVPAGTVAEAGLTENGVAAADLTEDQKAAKEAEYQASLEQQRRDKGEQERASMAQRFGADKVVTIVIDGVVGETDAAHKYLNRKVFRAAYFEYEKSRKQAANQTEQNRKNAEQKAIQDHKDTWGEFGPGFVRYNYQLVDSDTPYPKIANGGRIDNTFTYYAAPASNVQEFANRIGVGNVISASGGQIKIQASLPTPIPDPDIEELVLQYGAEKVVHVKVSGANGDPRLVQMFIENESAKLADDRGRLQMVAMKPLGDGQFEFTAAPVSNPQVFGESIPWGSLQNVDCSERIVSIAATLPEHLPTESELKAAQAAERAKEKAIRDADWAHKPRPDESELDWAVRVIKDVDVWGIEKALKALTYMDVVEERREEISRLLIQNLGATHFGLKAILPAMMHWRTEDTETAILRLGGGHMASWDRPVVMEALVELNTPKTAEALASALPDFHSADASVKYLIEMGPIAEEPVLRFLKHENAKVRGRVYTILMEIGGSETMKKIRTNIKLENDAGMKAAAEACMEEVRTRVMEAREAEKKTSEGDVK
ncbi:hypothetical protein [Fuerstiella marisgermanici]|uniref:HEAT repeat domain-containing protein n=1 Tax=Fuerstiella marisgermanici TaxID=1891926 RepID=A0A1P8WNT8_9PLAN|nr:hypothetical protein [Fuerstiella marisgermanici]APZ95720.1 hypothetical protein Fuma_05381 [Fuerstiella marisgermanici]